MSAGVGPVAIGGVGGSGTRLVAGLVASLGWWLGDDLNEPRDNLWFALLFKHPSVPSLDPADFMDRWRLFEAAMTGARALTAAERELVAELATLERPQHPRPWLEERARTLLESRPLPTPRTRWGWKEPNTHIVLPQLLENCPGLRYVHVVRNGLDMAFSRNQNQLQFWGERVLGRPVQVTARDSLAYWCAVHRRIAGIGGQMGEAFLWLDYDRLCLSPREGLDPLASFLGVAPDAAAGLLGQVRPPDSIGRHRSEPLDQFDPADLDYLRSIGHLD